MKQRIEAVAVGKGFVMAVGDEGVTNIIFGEAPGPMGNYRTVEVWKGEQIHALFPFHQILGVYYRKD